MKITRLRNSTIEVLSADEIAQWVRIDPGADPLTVAMLRESAVEEVEAITSRSLRDTEYRIDYQCGGSSFDLPLNPVTAVTSVQVDGLEIDPAGWSFHCNRLTLTAAATGRVSVFVNAGYVGTSDMPVSLRHAVAVLMAAGYSEREAIDERTTRTVRNLCRPYIKVVL